MIAQTLQRVFTFFLNTLLLRFVSAEVIGFASNDMELLMSTILFISRESVRIVTLKSTADVLATDKPRRQMLNLAWLPASVGLAMSVCLAAAAQVHVDDAVERRSTLLYCAAAAVESLSEPFFIIVQVQRRPQARAAVEVTATFVRVLVTFVGVAVLALGPMGFCDRAIHFLRCGARRFSHMRSAVELAAGGAYNSRDSASATFNAWLTRFPE